MTTQIAIMPSEQDIVTVSISQEQLAELDSIAGDASSRFININEGGFTFQERTFTDLLVRIVEWNKIFYRWVDGKKKEIADGLDDEQARAQGFKPGAELRLIIQAPVEIRGAEASLSLPVSSYLNFAPYARHLRNNGTTPAHVITRLGTSIRQFKIGAPVPVVTFVAVGFVSGSDTPETNDADKGRASSNLAIFDAEDSEEGWGE